MFPEMQLNLPLSRPDSPKDKDQAESHPLDDRYIQLQEEQQKLHHQEACLHAWNDLQGDMHQLHQLFADFNKIVDVSLFIYRRAKLWIVYNLFVYIIRTKRS